MSAPIPMYWIENILARQKLERSLRFWRRWRRRLRRGVRGCAIHDHARGQIAVIKIGIRFLVRHHRETLSRDTERQSGDAEMPFRRPEIQSRPAERAFHEGKRSSPRVSRFTANRAFRSVSASPASRPIIFQSVSVDFLSARTDLPSIRRAKRPIGE